MLKLFLRPPDRGGGNAISFYLLKDQESTQCNMNFQNYIFERSDNHGGGNVADVITEIDDDCHSSSDKRE